MVPKYTALLTFEHFPADMVLTSREHSNWMRVGLRRPIWISFLKRLESYVAGRSSGLNPRRSFDPKLRRAARGAVPTPAALPARRRARSRAPPASREGLARRAADCMGGNVGPSAGTASMTVAAVSYAAMKLLTHVIWLWYGATTGALCSALTFAIETPSKA